MSGAPLAFVGAAVLTMDPEQPQLDDGVVVVEGEHIAAVGPRASTPIPTGATVIDARDLAITPGLINTHTHIPQVLLRGGVSSDRSLLDWLLTALYPGLAAYDADDIACAYRLYLWEAMRAGVTTVLAHDHVTAQDYLAGADPALDVLARSGMRAFYARMFSDRQPAGSSDDHVATLRARRPRVQPAYVRRETDAVLADLERLIDVHGSAHGGRIQVIPSPSTASATTLTALRAAERWARERTGLWTLHVSETPEDRPDGVSSAIRFLDAHGLLSDRLVAGHCVHLDEVDIGLLRRHDVAVSLQPVSNGILGSGIAPLPALLNAGLRIGLGTDDANCNDAVNPLADLKTLGVLQRALHRDPAVIDAHTLLRIATLGGAEALGIADRVGSIEVGKRADLVAFSLRSPHLVPHRDLAATLVWQANGSEPRHVLVDGAFVLRDRRAVFLDALGPTAHEDLLQEASDRSARIVARAGL